MPVTLAERAALHIRIFQAENPLLPAHVAPRLPRSKADIEWDLLVATQKKPKKPDPGAAKSAADTALKLTP